MHGARGCADDKVAHQQVEVRMSSHYHLTKHLVALREYRSCRQVSELKLPKQRELILRLWSESSAQVAEVLVNTQQILCEIWNYLLSCNTLFGFRIWRIVAVLGL